MNAREAIPAGKDDLTNLDLNYQHQNTHNYQRIIINTNSTYLHKGILTYFKFTCMESFDGLLGRSETLLESLIESYEMNDSLKFYFNHHNQRASPSTYNFYFKIKKDPLFTQENELKYVGDETGYGLEDKEVVIVQDICHILGIENKINRKGSFVVNKNQPRKSLTKQKMIELYRHCMENDINLYIDKGNLLEESNFNLGEGCRFRGREGDKKRVFVIELFKDSMGMLNISRLKRSHIEEVQRFLKTYVYLTFDDKEWDLD